MGIISSIDLQNNCCTFASHGDYLFFVDNSEIYQIGDVVLYDGRILDEDYALTLKIQQSIVGKVTAKIYQNLLAIFKDLFFTLFNFWKKFIKFFLILCFSFL